MFESFRPYHFRPVAQLDRAHPSEGCDPGSNPGGPTRLGTVSLWEPGLIAGLATLYRVLDICGCPEPQGGVMQQQVRRFTDTHLRGGDRLVRYSAVYGAYAGSIPVRRATSFVPVV